MQKPWQIGLQKIQGLYAPPKSSLLDEEGERFIEALNPYSSQGRIGRLRYLAWSMAALLTIGIPLYLVTSILAFISSNLSYLSVLLFLAGAVSMIVCSFRFTIQRLHDIDLSGWLVLLLFCAGGRRVFLHRSDDLAGQATAYSLRPAAPA